MLYTPSISSVVIFPKISRSACPARNVVSVLRKIHLPKLSSAETEVRSHRSLFLSPGSTVWLSATRTPAPTNPPITSTHTL